MGCYLQYGTIGLLLIWTVLWAAENTYFMRNASPRATKACAGKTGFFDGRNSYYWCLRRVEAGGSP
jgi:hypothetical protein